jgi:GNAT superfamily N-acetyltransferase
MTVPTDRVAQPSDNVPEDVERLLRSLPEWFGIEHSLLEYVEDSKRLPTYVVRDQEDGPAVGVLLVRRHFPAAAEVHLMAVDRAWHRQGVGKALLHVAEEDLRREGVRFLQGKTLRDSRIDENYDRTRRFYLAQGFTPLEEFPDLWDAGNPCLQLVKSL